MEFRQKVDLRAARITEIKRHPDAEKLYIETVDLGAEKRTIVSGLVPHYKRRRIARTYRGPRGQPEEPALLRGVESKGMLLAAQEGKTVEVLFVDHARPGGAGSPWRYSEYRGGGHKPPFSRCLSSRKLRVLVGDAALECAGKPVVTAKVAKGRVK